MWGQDQGLGGGTKGLLGKTGGGGWGCWQPGALSTRELRPASSAVPGSQAALGALGLQPGPQGVMPAWPLSQAMEAPGYCVGQGEGRRGRREPRKQAGGCLNVPAPCPFPRTGLASLEYKRGLEQWESYAQERL